MNISRVNMVVTLELKKIDSCLSLLAIILLSLFLARKYLRLF